MPSRPVIGITTDHNTRDDQHTQYLLPYPYAHAVEAAGGLPILLPYRVDLSLVPQYVAMCAGFVFSGGNDYDPASFGQARHPKAVPTDPFRERFERALLAEVERVNRPVLGICGGCQLMNIHRGGSLHQFIPDLGKDPSIEHRRFDIAEWSRRHPVRLNDASTLARRIGSIDLSVNTSHKQSIDRVGSNLNIIGHSPDGIVEAIEDTTRPFYVGVQWHPERQHEEPLQGKLFRLLVDASR